MGGAPHVPQSYPCQCPGCRGCGVCAINMDDCIQALDKDVRSLRSLCGLLHTLDVLKTSLCIETRELSTYELQPQRSLGHKSD